MFQPRKVASFAGVWLSPLWVLSNNYPNFGHFPSKLLENPAFGDVSAAKVLVASLAGVWLFSFMGPLKYLSQLAIFPQNYLKTLLLVMFQQQQYWLQVLHIHNFSHFRSKLLDKTQTWDIISPIIVILQKLSGLKFSFH